MPLFGASQVAPVTPVPVSQPPPKEAIIPHAERLAHFLSSQLKLPVKLMVTDNRSTMVSFRKSPEGVVVRVHHMFVDAPSEVHSAIAEYAGRRSQAAGAILDEYIRAQKERIRNEPSASLPLNARGRHFDLKEMFDRLNQRHFEGKIQATIGWGRMAQKRRRRSIRMGVYEHRRKEIRIHPALDKAFVPAYFVEFIVFHEMLHQVFPTEGHDGFDGRKVHHSAEFRAREKTFPHYEPAMVWEKQNLKLLLSS